MKCVLFIVLFLHVFVASYGQDYNAYHLQIAKAEEAVVQNDFKTALGIYDSLCYAYSFVIPKDCFVAAQIACYLEQDERCKTYFTKGLPTYHCQEQKEKLQQNYFKLLKNAPANVVWFDFSPRWWL